MSGDDHSSEESDSVIRWQGDVPVSARFDDVYFSARDGLAETRHVFLQGNRLFERWPARDWRHHPRFVIGELGFGTGLNFLAAWEAWRSFWKGKGELPEGVRPQLHFVSCERMVLPPGVLQRALAVWRRPRASAAEGALPNDLLDSYLAAYPRIAVSSRVSPFRRVWFDRASVSLTLMHGEALEVFSALDSAPVDAWFLDGFAPKKNPEMWRRELLAELARLSGPRTTFATFSSAGQVRRDLIDAGFRPEKSPGFGTKREMLRGGFGREPRTRTDQRPPWFRAGTTARRGGNFDAVVIGAGLAGSSTALALADRGFRVCVIEREPGAGRGASGNAAAAVAPVIAAVPDPVSRLTFAAFVRFLAHRERLLAEGHAFSSELCGLIQLAEGEDARRQREGLRSHGIAPEFARSVSREEASRLAGVELSSGGLCFPDGGWVRPAELCRANLGAAGDGAVLVGATEAIELRDIGRERAWQVVGSGGKVVASAPVVVIANGTDSRSFTQTEFLRLRPLRGQIDYFPRLGKFMNLKMVVSYGGGVIPSDPVVVGSTFDQRSLDPEFDPTAARELVNRLERGVPGLKGAADPRNPVQGRVAFRAVSPDAFPIAGPVPDRDAFLEDYQRLRYGDKRVEYPPARVHDGLYVTAAHGSRGVIYSHFCAELLAAEITGEPAPCERELAEIVHPARFLVRDLIRRKV